MAQLDLEQEKKNLQFARSTWLLPTRGPIPIANLRMLS